VTGERRHKASPGSEVHHVISEITEEERERERLSERVKLVTADDLVRQHTTLLPSRSVDSEHTDPRVTAQQPYDITLINSEKYTTRHVV